MGKSNTFNGSRSLSELRPLSPKLKTFARNDQSRSWTTKELRDELDRLNSNGECCPVIKQFMCRSAEELSALSQDAQAGRIAAFLPALKNTRPSFKSSDVYRFEFASWAAQLAAETFESQGIRQNRISLLHGQVVSYGQLDQVADQIRNLDVPASCSSTKRALMDTLSTYNVVTVTASHAATTMHAAGLFLGADRVQDLLDKKLDRLLRI